MGEGAFAAGVLFPAIPLVIEKGIGIDVLKKYLVELN
jgi:hydrogenase-4 membrane subunit HyfE